MSELSVNASDPEFDSEIDAFLQLPPNEQFASIIADIINEFGEECDLPLKHTFTNGMYMREMFIPKGTLIIGKMHKVECINICSKGEIEILTDSTRFTVKAGFSAVSAPGTLKIGLALEDTIWVNVFRANEGNIDIVERDLVFSNEEAISRLDPRGIYFKRKEIVCQPDGCRQELPQ